jgi:Homeodomain-like domain
MIEEGLTVRQIAARVDRSPTTVRYWIRAHDLPFTTRRGRRPRTIVDITEGGALVAVCPTHGAVEHGIDGRRRLRCLQCRMGGGRASAPQGQGDPGRRGRGPMRDLRL